MYAANDNNEEIDMAIPPDYHQDIVLWTWKTCLQHMSLFEAKWFLLTRIRNYMMPENIMWEYVVEALEWLAQLPKEEKEQLLCEYSEAKLIA